MTNITVPLDTDIGKDRNRPLRFIVLIGFIIITYTFAISFICWLGAQFFPDNNLVQSLASVTGFALATGLIWVLIEKLFLIRNNTTNMFVTQNTFASIFGLGKVNMLYGPGTHLCFPWERRLEGNNISLEEATNKFDFTVQCTDGTLRGVGSFRLRPNQDDPVTFLSSVSAVADDITDLIVQEIISHFSGKSVREALDNLTKLNQHLDREFRQHDTEVEKRCGVQISDVTVKELLPSTELQRTLSAISEAQAVARGVEILLGVSNREELAKRLQDGSIHQEDIDRARRDFLSISGNLEGMNVDRKEFAFSVRGIDADAIKALTDLAKTPAAQAAATAVAARKAATPKRKEPKKS